MRPRAAKAARGAERRRGCAFPGSRPQPEVSRRPDHGLCGWTARLRDGQPQSRRHRQQPDGHSRRAGQGRARPLRHALAATAAQPSCAPTGGLARSPGHWLFPGRDGEHPINPTVLHAACRSACAAAGLNKRVTVHTLRQQLRHAHLLESTAPTFASIPRSPCSAIATSTPRPAMRMWRPAPSAARQARSTGCGWR